MEQRSVWVWVEGVVVSSAPPNSMEKNEPMMGGYIKIRLFHLTVDDPLLILQRSPAAAPKLLFSRFHCHALATTMRHKLLSKMSFSLLPDEVKVQIFAGVCDSDYKQVGPLRLVNRCWKDLPSIGHLLAVSTVGSREIASPAERISTIGVGQRMLSVAACASAPNCTCRLLPTPDLPEGKCPTPVPRRCCCDLPTDILLQLVGQRGCVDLEVGLLWSAPKLRILHCHNFGLMPGSLLPTTLETFSMTLDQETFDELSLDMYDDHAWDFLLPCKQLRRMTGYGPIPSLGLTSQLPQLEELHWCIYSSESNSDLALECLQREIPELVISLENRAPGWQPIVRLRLEVYRIEWDGSLPWPWQAVRAKSVFVNTKAILPVGDLEVADFSVGGLEEVEMHVHSRKFTTREGIAYTVAPSGDETLCVRMRWTRWTSA